MPRGEVDFVLSTTCQRDNNLQALRELGHSNGTKDQVGHLYSILCVPKLVKS